MAAATIPPEQAALLAAIVAEPDEDTPRLVYADWLEENGNAEQAAFIRDSIALDRDAVPPKEQRKVRLRAEWLEVAHQDRWFAALGVRQPTGWGTCRGFVERIHCAGLADFFETVPAWFGVAPVRSVTIDEPLTTRGRVATDAQLERLAETPELVRLRTLGLWGQTGASRAGWRALFRSGHLSGLRTLVVQRCGLGGREVADLVNSPALAGLTTLGLAENPLGAAGLRAVLKSRHLRGVTRLSLAGVLDDLGPVEVVGLLTDLAGRFGEALDVECGFEVDFED